jgi:hypothetical protein
MCTAAVACGSGGTQGGVAESALSGDELPGWRAVASPPGIAELAPNLSGLNLTGRADSPALVRDGDAVRATTLLFATEADAGEALSRASAEGFTGLLFEKLHGGIRRIATRHGVGYRVTVTRPAGPGEDTIELYLLRRGRALVLVEFLSAAGFDPVVREQVLARVSR